MTEMALPSGAAGIPRPMWGKITCADCDATVEGYISAREIDIFLARHYRVAIEGVRAGNDYCYRRWRDLHPGPYEDEEEDGPAGTPWPTGGEHE